MTLKEIVDGLQFTLDMFLFDPTTGETYQEPRNDMDKITIDACKGAIELLEKQPCEDCISREAAIDTIKKIHPVDTEYDCTLYDKLDVIYVLRKLPSVQPQPKRGKWISQEDELGEYASGCFECSNCHEVFWVESGTPQDNEYNYCPNCGADMREVQG